MHLRIEISPGARPCVSGARAQTRTQAGLLNGSGHERGWVRQLHVAHVRAAVDEMACARLRACVYRGTGRRAEWVS
jgi:hypothetical protein